jgi:hypothetical protein
VRKVCPAGHFGLTDKRSILEKLFGFKVPATRGDYRLKSPTFSLLAFGLSSGVNAIFLCFQDVVLVSEALKSSIVN